MSGKPGGTSGDTTPPPGAPVSAWQLYATFSRMSLGGFGGVFPLVYRTLVERMRWIPPTDFAATWAFGQMLPGSVICNVATMVGYRHAGGRGAFAAVLGLIMWPLIVLLAIGTAYAFLGDLAPVRHALTGMSAAAVGLSMATAMKMLRNLPRRWQHFFVAACVFIAIGLLRLPFLGVFAVAAPLSVWFLWRTR